MHTFLWLLLFCILSQNKILSSWVKCPMNLGKGVAPYLLCTFVSPWLFSYGFNCHCVNIYLLTVSSLDSRHQQIAILILKIYSCVAITLGQHEPSTCMMVWSYQGVIWQIKFGQLPTTGIPYKLRSWCRGGKGVKCYLTLYGWVNWVRGAIRWKKGKSFLI